MNSLFTKQFDYLLLCYYQQLRLRGKKKVCNYIQFSSPYRPEGLDTHFTFCLLLTPSHNNFQTDVLEQHEMLWTAAEQATS